MQWTPEKALREELDRFDKFVKGETRVFTHHDIGLCDRYFDSFPKIMKIQVLTCAGVFHGIFTKGLPLLYKKGGFKEANISDLRSHVKLSHPVNVNQHRQKVIFNSDDLKLWLGEEETRVQTDLLKDEKPQKQLDFPVVKSTVSEHLSSYNDDSRSVSRFFSQDDNVFLNEVAKHTREDFSCDSLYFCDHFSLYDPVWTDLPENDVDLLFEILAEHPDLLEDQPFSPAEYQYYISCFNPSDYNEAELSCFVLRQFYVNVA
ncbi:Hypothetical protein POVR1_LOCUS130 [uncultured virus]|nr:Hypothetical protein POVR1_LOCUS130 [uncultured virus]